MPLSCENPAVLPPNRSEYHFRLEMDSENLAAEKMSYLCSQLRGEMEIPVDFLGFSLHLTGAHPRTMRGRIRRRIRCMMASRRGHVARQLIRKSPRKAFFDVLVHTAIGVGAALVGSILAQVACAQNCSGVPYTFQAALAGAQKGDPEFMAVLSEHYYCGSGVQQSFQEAFQWAEAGAKKNYPIAMALVGYLYETGHGVAVSGQAAGGWYLRAAQAGNTDGYKGLFRLYNRGSYRPETNNEAQYLVLFLKGEQAFTAKQYAVSLRDMRQASALGWSWATRDVGVHYEFGDGVPVNYQTALQWYSACEKSGNLACNQSYDNLWAQINATNAQKNAGRCPTSYEAANCAGMFVNNWLCFSQRFPGCTHPTH